MRLQTSSLTLAFILAACGTAANDAPVEPAAETAPSQSAEIQRSATRNAYFGDTHIHTGNSFDAYIFNVRATPDDAYLFAKGEPIRHGGGFDIQLAGPPLDFLAVTDHGEYMGVIPAMDTTGHPLSETETAQIAFGENAAESRAVFQRIGASFVIGEPIEEIRDQALMNSVWADTVAAAERHNEPGTFTTFSAYEFTAMRALDLSTAANLHRNVIFRDQAPEQLFTTLDSNNPQDLWVWMDSERADGRDVLAIPHNSNSSNGEMFALQTYEGAPITLEYARTRLLNEPLVEITQIKGTSETHPNFSPNDEWAGHELYTYFIGTSVQATVEPGGYVRPALARGLAFEREIGANPYQFGLIGASDTHNGAATLVEENHWGKFALDGTPAGRGSVPPGGADNWSAGSLPALRPRTQYSASGLAGVWADANTRADIFDAMRRRETFGTSGPRMKVRFFAGDYISAGMLDAADLLEQAYANGVPMGGVTQGSAPGFLAWAMRDPLSAPLDRLQIVKVWNEDGAAAERVFDVACSDGSAPDPQTHRCADNGASVDTATCATDEGAGVAELKAHWRDPSFSADQDAAYYVRVLENPTCRWSTWDAVRTGTPPNPEVPETVQERAWTSPIWFSAN